MNFFRRIFGLCVHEPVIKKAGTTVQLPKSQHEHNVLHVLKVDTVVCQKCHTRIWG